MMVLMALVTTIATTPVLEALRRRVVGYNRPADPVRSVRPRPGPEHARGTIDATTAAAALFAAAVCSAQPCSAAAADKADALSAAARKGDAAAVKALLDEGVDVNTKYRYGVTVLIYACDHGHLDVVKLLLDRGADVNVKDSFYGVHAADAGGQPGAEAEA